MKIRYSMLLNQWVENEVLKFGAIENARSVLDQNHPRRGETHATSGFGERGRSIPRTAFEQGRQGGKATSCPKRILAFTELVTGAGTLEINSPVFAINRPRPTIAFDSPLASCRPTFVVQRRSTSSFHGFPQRDFHWRISRKLFNL